ncbi:MAG TPA: hypothetical protein VGS04_01925 [Nitrososphaerales archaeon]|nr:hypothetical protein [Nitrososphaerales archaeon]
MSDIDLLSIWEKPEELAERMTFEGPLGTTFVDVLWIPASKMLDAVEAAGYKILPHLLLESEIVWMRSESVGPLIENIRLNAYNKGAWERRLNSQMAFGDAALHEAVNNLAFPPAALFFLQTAHAYYLMALADCLRKSTMGMLTKPIGKLRKIEPTARCDLENRLLSNLKLGVNPLRALEALDRIHRAVAARCLGADIRGVTGKTSGHYYYSLSPTELHYRQSVAAALIWRGELAAADFYIRFWAYSLSRCPIVLEEARQGRKPSFYVPHRRLKESLLTACPEIVKDVEDVLGGPLTPQEAEASVEGTEQFKRVIAEEIRSRGFLLRGAKGTPDGLEV